MDIRNDACLQLKGISKYFPGVIALNQMDFDLNPGEVHALCGENGAGKSTLMNIVSGNTQAEEGSIYLNGKETHIPNQQEAQKLGISIVYQEGSLVPNLNVAENIFSGHQPRNRFGLIDFGNLFKQTRTLLNQLQLSDIDPRTKSEYLAPPKQQMVEIAKALSQNPSILILDEPTASITETETKTLFKIIKNLKQKGVSIIYISHRMSEIFQIADRITVLKDGKYQGTNMVKDIDIKGVIKMMVGRDLDEQQYQSTVQDEIVLETKKLSGQAFNEISFKLRKGEILGLSGLIGAGRTEVARAIVGADPKLSGELLIRNSKVNFNHPADSMKAGIVYLSEHRKELGLFLQMSVKDNLLVSSMVSASSKGIVNKKKADEISKEYIDKLNISTPSSEQEVTNLSGGNQQKVLLGRCLLLQPEILIIDEPTQGVDVGAKVEIYKILRQLTQNGTSILLISSELPEVLTLSDRILVMCNGILTAEFSKEDATEDEIIHYASGLKTMYA